MGPHSADAPQKENSNHPEADSPGLGRAGAGTARGWRLPEEIEAGARKLLATPAKELSGNNMLFPDLAWSGPGVMPEGLRAGRPAAPPELQQWSIHPHLTTAKVH